MTVSQESKPTMEGAVRRAAQEMLADHMTSKTHHPGYVLVPTSAFESLRIAISAWNADGDGWMSIETISVNEPVLIACNLYVEAAIWDGHIFTDHEGRMHWFQKPTHWRPKPSPPVDPRLTEVKP